MPIRFENYHPPCYAPRCDGHFVERINRRTNNPFFGCSNFPKCRTTRTYDSVYKEYTAEVIGENPDSDIDFPNPFCDY